MNGKEVGQKVQRRKKIKWRRKGTRKESARRDQRRIGLGCQGRV